MFGADFEICLFNIIDFGTVVKISISVQDENICN